MAPGSIRKRKKRPGSLPDLDQAKSAVLDTLSSADAQRGYRHAIDEFHRVVLLGTETFIESCCSRALPHVLGTAEARTWHNQPASRCSPATGIRGVEHGLLSPDLAAGIRRVRGLKKLGVRLGNWLTAEQAQNLWQTPRDHVTKQVHDRALLALLLSCGLRRHELVQLDTASLQQREDHWAIVDLEGKAGHMRTVPIPEWVKGLVDEWLMAACIAEGGSSDA